MDCLLTQKDAARVLGLSVRTLERHRLAGTGPAYARLGHLIRYRECDLVEWVRGSICTSTSHLAVYADGRASAKSETDKQILKNDIGQTGTVVGNQSKRRIAITRQPHVGLLSADLADAEALPRRPTNNDDAQIYKPQSIDSDVDARMATIRETLVVAGMPLLERCSLIAEWVHHAETKALSFGQNVQKSGPGRPEGGCQSVT